jgi:hypothetical protein
VAMAYYEEYLELHHPGTELANFTLWEIGHWSKEEIFVSLTESTEFLPEILEDVVNSGDYFHLPYCNLRYYRTSAHIVIFGLKSLIKDS